METPRKTAAIAALAAAATNLLGFVVFFALLEPKGVGSTDTDPNRIVALYADNRVAVRAWYLLIFLVFGGCLIVLSLALPERLRAGSPELAPVVRTFGLIWAVLVIVVGTLSINDLDTIVKLHADGSAQAGTVWTTLDSVETGLGGGGGETVVSGLWLLLVGWVGLRGRELPKLLSSFGMAIGGAGVLAVVVDSIGLMAVNGLGLITWFAWLGIVVLRTRSTAGKERVASGDRAARHAVTGAR